MSYVGEAEGEISPMSRKKMYYGCTTILLPFYKKGITDRIGLFRRIL